MHWSWKNRRSRSSNRVMCNCVLARLYGRGRSTWRAAFSCKFCPILSKSASKSCPLIDASYESGLLAKDVLELAKRTLGNAFRVKGFLKTAPLCAFSSLPLKLTISESIDWSRYTHWRPVCEQYSQDGLASSHYRH